MVAVFVRCTGYRYPISFQISPYILIILPLILPCMYLYHVFLTGFGGRIMYLRVLIFFGSHKNFCRPQKGNYNCLFLQAIGKHKYIGTLPHCNNLLFRNKHVWRVMYVRKYKTYQLLHHCIALEMLVEAYCTSKIGIRLLCFLSS